MKKRLLEHLENDIFITEINGKQNVVTLRITAASIVHDFYSCGKDEDSQANQLRIVETAAKLIQNDIKHMQAKEEYSTPAEMSDVQENIEYAPESLVHLVRVLLSGKDVQVNIEYAPESLVHLVRVLLSGKDVQVNIEYAPESLVHLVRVLLSGKDVQENIEYVPESLVHLVRVLLSGKDVQENIEYVPESLVHLVRVLLSGKDVQVNIEYAPESLVHLVRVLLSGKDFDLKLPSLGQALIQASRPRTLMPPLQLGIGVQLHHHFASTFFIHSLNRLGFVHMQRVRSLNVPQQKL